MIELPEARSLARQLNETVKGKAVKHIWPPSYSHKFCWFQGDAENYDVFLHDSTIVHAKALGIFVEIEFDNGYFLCFNDGVNVRLLLPADKRPQKYQLLMDFEDGCSLLFTVAMYGGIICHNGAYDNAYYLISKNSVSPLDEKFDYVFFNMLMDGVKPNISLKAFLATEQRIPGLGNGVLQDILFLSGLHPKRKLQTLGEEEKRMLFNTLKAVMSEMEQRGGRDTEKDLFGKAGGYRTLLSKNNKTKTCPHCGGAVIKEAYLGGSVYYCPVCQPMKE